MDSFALVNEIGFFKAGYWTVENGKLQLNLSKKFASATYLYLFCDEKNIYYLGLTYGKLEKRLNQYKNISEYSGVTNKLVNKKLTELLNTTSKEVWIMYYKDDMHETYKGIPLNVAAGLEYSLITKLSAQWNQRKGGGLFIPVDEIVEANVKDKIDRAPKSKKVKEVEISYENEKYRITFSDRVKIYDAENNLFTGKNAPFLRQIASSLDIPYQQDDPPNNLAQKIISFMGKNNGAYKKKN